jgi:hypothetical protein
MLRWWCAGYTLSQCINKVSKAYKKNLPVAQDTSDVSRTTGDVAARLGAAVAMGRSGGEVATGVVMASIMAVILVAMCGAGSGERRLRSLFVNRC